ncbi:MAG: c-type cytochrome, partial [Bacteroidota bacterium]|nr:c-type cytochrome [Bacteroidota bacterium]
LKDQNPDIRITALRAARELKLDLVPYLKQLVNDQDTQVRRDVAIALRNNKSAEAADLWAQLAMKHDGKDRWYLEALGIGAQNNWNKFYTTWLKKVGNTPLQGAGNRDIIWRARTGEAVPLLAQLATETSTPLENRLRYFRAFDFNPDAEKKSAALVKMMDGNSKDQNEINLLVLNHVDPSQIRKSPVAMKALQDVLNAQEGKPEFVEMVSRYGFKEENQRLLQLALKENGSNLGRKAAETLLKHGGVPMAKKALNDKDEQVAVSMLASLRGVGTKESLKLIEEVAFDASTPLAVRREAARSIGGSYDGEERVLELLRNEKFPPDLKASAVNGLSYAWRKSVRTEASSYLVSDSGNENNKLPPLNDLLNMKGNQENGLVVFQRNCMVCHQAKDIGMDFGPKLSEIGSKLPREAQFISILYPDAGISFGYEGYVITMKDGSTNAGIIASRTETDIDLKTPGGNTVSIKTNDVASIKQLENSMMPSGLENAMTTQELVDLVEYLMTLKKEDKAG